MNNDEDLRFCPACEELVEFEDNACSRCGRTESVALAYVEFKKRNPQDGSNWGLTHHSCNVSEAWVRKRLDVVDNIAVDVPFTYKVSTKMELQWIRFMIDHITKQGQISWDRALNVGALEIDGSQETVKRYLKKHLADPDNRKSLFKSTMDGMYNTQIKFTDHVAEYMNKQR